jgi:hypothetical protein
MSSAVSLSVPGAEDLEERRGGDSVAMVQSQPELYISSAARLITERDCNVEAQTGSKTGKGLFSANDFLISHRYGGHVVHMYKLHSYTFHTFYFILQT